MPERIGVVFFFNDTATTEIYTLSLHDALPICPPFTLQELYAMGYPLIIEAQGGLMMAYGDMHKAYLELKQQGRISCEDRKSTRLNSSHANTSYAVFCLKKKASGRNNRGTCTTT